MYNLTQTDMGSCFPYLLYQYTVFAGRGKACLSSYENNKIILKIWKKHFLENKTLHTRLHKQRIMLSCVHVIDSRLTVETYCDLEKRLSNQLPI